MSNVIVFKNVLVNGLSKGVYEKQEDYTGQFIAHGIDYLDLENGVGQYSTFIVRKENGDVENVPVEFCKLIGDL